jgi:glycine cleavage system H protein
MNFNIPENLKYTTDHAWVRLKNDTAFIGITDYAQQLETYRVMYINMPERGVQIEKGADLVTLDGAAGSLTIHSPLTGIIIDTNDKAQDNPESVNNDPYGDDGWLCRIRYSNDSELDDLLDHEAYADMI